MSRGLPPSRNNAPWPRTIDAAVGRRLLEAAGDLLLWVDAEGQVADVHARDPDLLELARRDWRGRTWLETVTVESREKVAELMAAALHPDGAVPEWRQVNHPMHGAQDLPVLCTAFRLSGGGRSRAPAALMVIGRDLRATEALQRGLVEAQQAMERDYWRFREAEARYRSLFQASAEAVLIVDGATLRILEANPAAVALLGDAPLHRGRSSSAAGPLWTSLFTADAAEPLANALAAARSLGRHDPVRVTCVQSPQPIDVAISMFRQNQATFLLVRLVPLRVEGGRTRGRGISNAQVSDGGQAAAAWSSAFVRSASDAVVFTDAAGRVVAVNRSFARLAQLSSEDQARGQMLDRWLGRTGVELSVLLANLRKDGAAGLFVTELRGELGMSTEVEIAASPLEPSEQAVFAFALRDVGRRLVPVEPAAPQVPASVDRLAELVGRVPLKQIVAETVDMIERLSIESALAMTRDNRAHAAQLLGLSRQSLYVKLRRFGLGGLGDDDA